jgi:hypothetical protein
VSAFEATETRRAERRWVTGGVAVIAIVVVAQLAGGVIREAVENEPSYLEKVQTCLTERGMPYEPAISDPIAMSARRGALRTSVGGNGVTVSLGRSEDEAERLYDDYVAVGSPGSRLEQQRKVVFLWDEAPTAEQHQFMVLCTLDAQE